ncbi:MAG: hypothetical protein M3422_06485 [Actinomycetota bacterium]|nr:hypothetical protein [Actinomycetota bacterium]
MTDVDLDVAVADEHVRWAVYRRVIASLTADSEHTAVAAILRDPADLVARSAVVELVDTRAMQATDPAAFQEWAAGLDLGDLAAVHQEFVRGRVHDWTVYLAVENGHTPTAAEIDGVTNRMQRLLAEHSTSQAVLAVLAETGRTRKIRNIAANRIR